MVIFVVKQIPVSHLTDNSIEPKRKLTLKVTGETCRVDKLVCLSVGKVSIDLKLNLHL